jgi:hypothetical protein
LGTGQDPVFVRRFDGLELKLDIELIVEFHVSLDLALSRRTETWKQCSAPVNSLIIQSLLSSLAARETSPT